MLQLQSSITGFEGSNPRALPEAALHPTATSRLTDFIIDFNDTFAPGYDSWASGVHCRVAARLVDLADPLPEQTVLDVGTGTGLAALGAAEKVGRGGNVIGIDISEGMLAQARAKSPPCHLSLLGMAAEDLIFRDASFDLVTCGQTLNSLVDPFISLEEMHRVLRPGGRIVISLRTSDLSTVAQDLFFGSLDPLAQRYAILLPKFPDENSR